MIDWNIQSRSHICQFCQNPFEEKAPLHTLLFDQNRAYERLDVCGSCWKTQFSQGATERKGFVSYWQSVYTKPPPAPPEAIRKESAETLLRRLVERNEAQHEAARFILAAMLERKRALKVKAQVREDGRRIFIYEHAQSGDLLRITDPVLRLDQLEQVQKEVSSLLENGLPSDDSPGAPPAPPVEVESVAETIPAATDSAAG